MLGNVGNWEIQFKSVRDRFLFASIVPVLFLHPCQNFVVVLLGVNSVEANP